MTMQITKHNVRELIGMREDDIRNTAKKVSSCKVFVKTMKMNNGGIRT